jgi:hypothetical protein
MPEIRFFTDILDALERVAKDVRALTKLPKQRRDELLNSLTSAYTVVDGALLLVITRLGKLLERADRGDQNEFASELGRLDLIPEWLQIERDMSLCSSLRRTQAEMRRFFPSLASQAAVLDWQAVDAQMQAMLSGELQLAEYISNRLRVLSASANAARSSQAEFDRARGEVEKASRDLNAERRRLILAESELYALV